LESTMIKPTVDIAPDDIVRFMLYQQFYYGSDEIYNRTKNMHEHVPDSGIVIDSFYDLMVKELELIENAKYKEYLKYFHQNVHPIPLRKIYKKFQEKEEMLGAGMVIDYVKTVIVGECLLAVHMSCFNDAIANLKNIMVLKKGLTHKMHISVYKRKIQLKLKNLYALSDPNIGMIYSLGFLKCMAGKVNRIDVAENTQLILEKYFPIVEKKLMELLK
jgi:hypothetical protein